MENSIQIELISFEEYKSLIANISNSLVYNQQEWLSYLRSYISGEMLFIKINTEDNLILISGIVFKKAGIKIFGSPFEQWGTQYMGFSSTKPIEDYKKIFDSLFKFLRKFKHIMYMQICDFNLDINYCKQHKLKYESFLTQELDLNLSVDDILSRMEKNDRKKCRNYANHGYSIVRRKPDKDFIDLYYEQLIDVFKLQGKTPFYGLDRVEALFEAFKNSPNKILCLESKDKDGNSLGTAISFGSNSFCFTFGSASYTATKKSGMNHPLRFESIKYWKNQGIKSYDFGGYNPYKNCFHPNINEHVIVYYQSLPFIHFMKNIAKKVIGKLR